MRKITKSGIQRRVTAARRMIGDRIAGRTIADGGAGFPAAYDRYLERNEGAHFVGFPSKWRVDFPPFEKPAAIGVHLHVYYADLVGEICEQLAQIPVPFDLIVTDASGTSVTADDLAAAGAKNVRVLEVENHGRDIWPLIQVVNAGYLEPYDLIFKIHTKKSAWREEHATLAGSGNEWKESFYRDLLDNSENITEIINEFVTNPAVGVITSNGSMAGAEHWGSDEEIFAHLLLRLQLSYNREDLCFPSGSIYWIRGFVLQGLRSLRLDAADFESESGQIDGTTAHAVERIIGHLAIEAGYSMLERNQVDADSLPSVDSLAEQLANPQWRARCVSFYLPQFHPFAENNAWWGKGFTEWTNVSKARPVYRGHNQPLLPSEFGFYDLRLDEIREQQTALAKQFGVHAFMYYYYWFSGKKLMAMPIERLVASDIDQPFCIMWANENWTRRWDGDTKNVLIAQEYDKVPAEQFIEDVMPLLKDERYLRVDGAAVLAVYRIAQIPNYAEVIEHWRRRAREAGVGELHLMSVDVGANFDGLNQSYLEAGIQGALAFAPHNHEYVHIPHDGLGVDRRFRGNILSYQGSLRDGLKKMTALPESDFPGAMVAFDNTARRQWEPDLWYGSNPYTFRRWLRACVEAVAHRDEQHRVVIVNAWNEWAEAAVLEPTQRWGRTYLQATRAALI
ncbi:glycoside hydrolase family 99-like domain-containing protein [Gulosibacter sp. GYB002]|uniref:glycoside hydrolase family 99-like domain-containing protein n=1 Tax=Gulosibacter sp. GYB002 TaxID=2994391 RepID=UPI002F96B008